VAAYCAKYLPHFFKNLEEYKNGNYEEALKKLFLKFDESLLTPEAQKELQCLRDTVTANGSMKDEQEEGNEIKGVEEEGDEDNEEEEEENAEIEAAKLYDEACMPLEEVLKRYASTECKVKKALKKKGLIKAGPSPMIASRTTNKTASETGQSAQTNEAKVEEPVVAADFAEQEELDIDEIKRNSKTVIATNAHEQDYDEASNLVCNKKTNYF
jgi:hypothetical protein